MARRPSSPQGRQTPNAQTSPHTTIEHPNAQTSPHTTTKHPKAKQQLANSGHRHIHPYPHATASHYGPPNLQQGLEGEGRPPGRTGAGGRQPAQNRPLIAAPSDGYRTGQSNTPYTQLNSRDLWIRDVFWSQHLAQHSTLGDGVKTRLESSIKEV